MDDNIIPDGRIKKYELELVTRAEKPSPNAPFEPQLLGMAPHASAQKVENWLLGSGAVGFLVGSIATLATSFDLSPGHPNLVWVWLMAPGVTAILGSFAPGHMAARYYRKRGKLANTVIPRFQEWVAARYNLTVARRNISPEMIQMLAVPSKPDASAIFKDNKGERYVLRPQPDKTLVVEKENLARPVPELKEINVTKQLDNPARMSQIEQVGGEAPLLYAEVIRLHNLLAALDLNAAQSYIVQRVTDDLKDMFVIYDQVIKLGQPNVQVHNILLATLNDLLGELHTVLAARREIELEKLAVHRKYIQDRESYRGVTDLSTGKQELINNQSVSANGMQLEEKIQGTTT